MFCSPLQLIWDLTIHPPYGLVSSLTHRSMFGSDTICNSTSPPLADIVRFGPLRISASFTVFKSKKRFSHPYKKCFVSLSNRCFPLQPMWDLTMILNRNTGSFTITKQHKQSNDYKNVVTLRIRRTRETFCFISHCFISLQYINPTVST